MITWEEIEKIADMARLHLEKHEVTSASVDISGILEKFETIRSINTTEVLLADDISGRKNVMREDVVRENILGTPAELLQNANTKDGYVVVSAVFSEAQVS